MSAVLFVLFIVVPIAEIYAFVAVADAIGFLPALAWIVLVSAIGAALVRREGLGALRRGQQRLAAGEVPTKEIASGILILFGGALMLTPGFLTDVVGLALLFPPTRALLSRPVSRRLAASGPMTGFGGGPGRVRFTTFGPGGPGAPGAPGGADPFGFGARGGRGDDVIDADSWEVDDDPDRPQLGPDGRY
mgnify:CR=1 FL=1